LRIALGVRRSRRQILGGYFSGEIESLGKDVTTFSVGDQVFGAAGLRLGAYGENVALPARYTIVAKPNNMSFAEAAAVPLGGLNALHFMRRAKIQTGYQVLINGAGGSIRAHAVQIAKSMGRKSPPLTAAFRKAYCVALARITSSTIRRKISRTAAKNMALSSTWFQGTPAPLVLRPSLPRGAASTVTIIARTRRSHSTCSQTSATSMSRALRSFSSAASWNRPSTSDWLQRCCSSPGSERNLVDFHAACQEIEVAFITTVTAANVNEIDALITFWLTRGVRRFVLREMFHLSDSDVVDQARMPPLVLPPGAYARLRRCLLANYGDRAEFVFADAASLEASGEQMKANPFRRP